MLTACTLEAMSWIALCGMEPLKVYKSYLNSDNAKNSSPKCPADIWTEMNTGTTSDYTKTQVPSNLSQDLVIESSSHPALIFSAAVALALWWAPLLGCSHSFSPENRWSVDLQRKWWRWPRDSPNLPHLAHHSRVSQMLVFQKENVY